MKKIIVFALAMVLALSLLTACGGGSSNNGGGSTTTPPSNSTTTPPASQGGNDNASTPPISSEDRYTEYGLTLDGVMPQNTTSVTEETNSRSTYTMVFTVSEKLTSELIGAYANALFELTMSVSDDNKNYSSGDGHGKELTEITAEEAIDPNPETGLSEWYYLYAGATYNVVIYTDTNEYKLCIYTW